MNHKTKMLEQIEDGIFDSIPDDQVAGFTAALVDIGLISWNDHAEILLKHEQRKLNIARVVISKSKPANGAIASSD
jgi:hypothetical protein